MIIMAADPLLVSAIVFFFDLPVRIRSIGAKFPFSLDWKARLGDFIGIDETERVR